METPRGEWGSRKRGAETDEERLGCRQRAGRALRGGGIKAPWGQGLERKLDK